MNSGSPLRREIARITSSSMPGGSVSDSMSVTKPWRYFCPTSASRSCGLLDMSGSMGCPPAAGAAQLTRKVGHAHGATFETRKLCQGDVAQGAPDRGIHTLPGAPHAAEMLDATLTGAAAALGYGDRTLERVQDRRGTDRPRGARELIPATGAARRGHQACALQLLEQLAHGRHGEPRVIGHFDRAVQSLGLRGEVRQDDS